MSQTTATASSPQSGRTSSRRSALRSSSARRWVAESRLAVSRPIPCAAPVTRATGRSMRRRYRRARRPCAAGALDVLAGDAVLFEEAVVLALLDGHLRGGEADQAVDENRERHEEDADQAEVDLAWRSSVLRAAWRERIAGAGARAARPGAGTLAAVNRLGALVYDRLVMKRSQEAGLADARRDALALAQGEVLEIGAGTGLNIPAYPRTGITRLVLTEPHEPMRRQIAAKTARRARARRGRRRRRRAPAVRRRDVRHGHRDARPLRGRRSRRRAWTRSRAS